MKRIITMEITVANYPKIMATINEAIISELVLADHSKPEHMEKVMYVIDVTVKFLAMMIATISTLFTKPAQKRLAFLTVLKVTQSIPEHIIRVNKEH